MKNALTALVVSFLVSIGLTALCQEARKIEFRMQPGETLFYDMDLETATEYVAEMPRGTDRRTIVFKSDMRVLMRCTKLSPDGSVHVEITYPQFSLDTTETRATQVTRIVSDNDGARSYVDGKLTQRLTWENLEQEGRPNLKKLFASIIGFTLDRTGKVLDVRAPEEFTARFTGVDMKEFFRHQVIFPGLEIAPGAEWSQVAERESPPAQGPLGRQLMVDEASHKYESTQMAMGRQCARILSSITTRPKEEEVRDLKAFKQMNEGWSLIALDNGQLVMSEMRLSQEMETTQGGINTQVKTTGRVKTSLVPPSSLKTAPADKTPPADAK